MGNTYFMGVDNGGSMVKVVIFDELGGEVASSSARLQMLTPQAGSPNATWTSCGGSTAR